MPLEFNYLGMFCLGCFVGGVLSYGLKHITNESSFKETITAIFGAAFAGVVLVFLQYLVGISDGKFSSDAIYAYPIGLLFALMWAQVPSTIKNRIPDEHRGIRIIGWLHIIGLSLLTLFMLSVLGYKFSLDLFK